MKYDREKELGRALQILKETSRILTMAILNQQPIDIRIESGLKEVESDDPKFIGREPDGSFEIHVSIARPGGTTDARDELEAASSSLPTTSVAGLVDNLSPAGEMS
jgi:hypothetical protein